MRQTIRQKTIAAMMVSLTFLWVGPRAIADDGQQRTDDDWTLEQLLSQEIVTASKLSESLASAPGIVTVISADDIRRFGASNLRAVLDRLPSVITLSSHLFVQNVVSVRGNYSTHVNTDVLFLLNGRPVRETNIGGVTTSILTSFPLDTIDRIEVVRGPGSVLYGTNAYSGIINILTKKDGSSPVKTSFGVGSFGAATFNASGAFQRGELSLSGGVTVFQESGWEFEATDAAGVASSSNYGEDLVGLQASGGYKRLHFDIFASNNSQDHLSVPIEFPTTSFNTSWLFADIAFDLVRSNLFSSQLNVTYNLAETDFINQTGFAFEPRSSDWQFEWTSEVRPTESLNLVTGLLSHRHRGNGQNGPERFAVPNYGETWWSAYAQLDYQLTSKIKLIGGGQFNKPGALDLHFVPRVGTVLTITPRWGAKVLLAQAFRAPFHSERKIRTPSLLGNTDLTPQIVTTVDTQVFYHSPRMQVATTFFRNAQEDLITRIRVSPTLVQYTNLGEREQKGFELELKLTPTEGLYLEGSATHFLDEDPSIHLPHSMAKAGLSFEHPSGVTVGIYDSFFGTFDDVLSANPNRLAVNPDADSFHWMTGNLTLDLMKLAMNNSTAKTKLRLKIYAENLLDEAVYYPEFTFKAINTLPGRSGRAVYATMEVEW